MVSILNPLALRHAPCWLETLELEGGLASEMDASKKHLRLFTTLEQDGTKALPQEQGAGAAPSGASWGSCHLLTQPGTPLELAMLGWRTANPTPSPQYGVDDLAVLFRDHLMPSWAYCTRLLPGYAHSHKAWAEHSWLGVPGLCSWADARARWMESQVRTAIEEEHICQVVILGSGYTTLPYRCIAQHVEFFEVDASLAERRKKALLDAVLPDVRLHPRPRFVPVDVGSNLKALIPALTAAGFDPSLKCLVVMEGVLPHLQPERVTALLSDLSALAAPGSRFCFDFIHTDALEALHQRQAKPRSCAEAPKVPDGLAALAALAADKGKPLMSGLPRTASGMTRVLQPHYLRLDDFLLPANIQRQLLAPATLPGATAGCSVWRCGRVWRAPRPPAVPSFVGLVSAVKASPRLTLRGLPVSTGGYEPASRRASTAGGAEPPGTSAPGGTGAASRSCIFSSVYYLLWGSASSSQSSPPAEAAATWPSLPEGDVDWRLGTAIEARHGAEASGEASASGRGVAAAPDPPMHRLDRAQSLVLPVPRGAADAAPPPVPDAASEELGWSNWWWGE